MIFWKERLKTITAIARKLLVFGDTNNTAKVNQRQAPDTSHQTCPRAGLAPSWDVNINATRAGTPPVPANSADIRERRAKDGSASPFSERNNKPIAHLPINRCGATIQPQAVVIHEWTTNSWEVPFVDWAEDVQHPRMLVC